MSTRYVSTYNSKFIDGWINAAPTELDCFVQKIGCMMICVYREAVDPASAHLDPSRVGH